MNTLTVRSFNATSISSGDSDNDALFKTIGIILALSSGFFIGSSFVLKKKGLLQAGGVAGKGHAYLANSLWWMGMILMIIGEICNFVAYAFTQAILVTPLGALSVVISAVLSSIFLKERLSFEGKVGCALCVMGATIIVMHAPAQQTAPTIQEFQNLFFAPVFMGYTIFCIVTSIIIIWKIAPKYGSKNLFVYIVICSLIGSLSVVTTQGIGTAIVTTITKPGENQFKEWFFYVLSAFVIVTLLTEINYLNKALNLFNTAMVTPVYYVTFTGLTIISSAILSQGFKSAPISIGTVVMGFFVICSGIILLFKSKKDDSSSSKNVDSDNLKKEDENEDAFGIRASLGSIHRLSRSYPSQNSSTLPTNNKEYSKEYDNKESIGKDDGKQSQHKSIQSSRFSAGLPPINESSMNLYSYREDNREVYNTTPNESSITMGESFLSNDKKSPIIITTDNSSISASSSSSSSSSPLTFNNKNNNNNNNNNPSMSSLSPPLSPSSNNRNPIKSEFFIDPNSTTTSELYSGTTEYLNRDSSVSSRKSQQSLGLVERLKLGISHPIVIEDDNDFEGLVG